MTTHGTEAVEGHAKVALSRQVLPLLPSDRDACILDIGCGSGDLVALLRHEGYHRVEGVDTSAEQVALAAARGIPGVTQGDLFDALVSAAGALDAVVALDVLEHFRPEEAIEVLDAIARGLKPGGTFVARTPNGVSPFAGRYRYGDLTHGTSYTTRSLRQALGAAGFSSMRFRPVNPVPHGVLSALRLCVWLAIAQVLKAALAAETGQLRGHLVTQNLMVCARR